jgi:hypothetical protein
VINRQTVKFKTNAASRQGANRQTVKFKAHGVQRFAASLTLARYRTQRAPKAPGF